MLKTAFWCVASLVRDDYRLLVDQKKYLNPT